MKTQSDVPYKNNRKSIQHMHMHTPNPSVTSLISLSRYSKLYSLIDMELRNIENVKQPHVNS